MGLRGIAEGKTDCLSKYGTPILPLKKCGADAAAAPRHAMHTPSFLSSPLSLEGENRDEIGRADQRGFIAIPTKWFGQ